jgi:hypothetical protein
MVYAAAAGMPGVPALYADTGLAKDSEIRR